MATALEGNPDTPKKGPALHYPWGSWGQTLPGDRLGCHAQLLYPAPQVLLAPVYRILSSHSPQSNCPGLVGSCPGGAGALGEFLLEPRGILLRVVHLRWENTDMPWVSWADVCPSSERIHSLTHSLTHSFIPVPFPENLCSRNCARHQRYNSKPGNCDGSFLGYSAGDTHTYNTPPGQGIQVSFPKEMGSE